MTIMTPHSVEAALEALHALDGRAGMGTFQRRLVCVCALALASDAAEIVLVVLLSACVVPNGGVTLTAKLGAAACVGQLVGATAFGSAADKYGRRRLFVASGCVVALGGLASAVAPAHAAVLGVLRGVVGFGVGGGSALSAVLMVEYLPANGRGRLLLHVRALSTLGGIYVVVCAWLVLGNRGWRLLALLAAVPAVVSAVVARELLPESPRWLQRHGRAPEADAVVARVAMENGVELPPGAVRLCAPSSKRERRPSLGGSDDVSDDSELSDQQELLDGEDDDDPGPLVDPRQDMDDEDLRCCCCCCSDDEDEYRDVDRDEYCDDLDEDDDEAAFFGCDNAVPTSHDTTNEARYGTGRALRVALRRARPPAKWALGRCAACLRRRTRTTRQRDDGLAVAHALYRDGVARSPRVALWVGTLGRRTAPLWLLSILLGASYLATATLSSLLFARAAKEERPQDVDRCDEAFDYRGLAVGSVAEAASGALAALVVDGGRRRLLSALLAAAGLELGLLCFPLGTLATAFVSLVARAALFAGGAVAWACVFLAVHH